MVLKLTNSEFIQRAKAIHKGAYDYSLIRYKNNSSKVAIICPIHGVFEQRASNHIAGRGCQKCGGKEKQTTTEFFEKANQVHSDKYDYHLVTYKNAKTKVKIICPKHGVFQQTPDNHLNNGRGCPKCGGSAKLNSKEFIERAKSIHGERYKYDKVEYKNSNTKVVITCPLHGDFMQAPNHHLQGKGCRNCSYTLRARNLSMSKNDFLTRAEELHGELYDYSLVEFTNANTPVSIICPEHGVFSQIPSVHLRPASCKRCATSKLSESRKRTTEEFIHDAIKKHGDRYDYSKTIYVSSRDKLIIICPSHGEFKQIAHSHLIGMGCNKCAAIKKGKDKAFSIDFAHELARKKGGACLSQKYLNQNEKLKWKCECGYMWEAKTSNVVQGNWCPKCAGKVLSIRDMSILAKERKGKVLSKKYKTAKSKLRWSCSHGHEFEMTYDVVKRGGWCPKCTEGLGERIARIYFEELFEVSFPKSYPNWLRSNEGFQLELDGYAKKVGIAFEHQGRQHYSVQNRFIKDAKSLERRINLDQLKRHLCEVNGVVLIEIPEIPSLLKLDDVYNYIITEVTKKQAHHLIAGIKKSINIFEAYIPNSTEYLEEIRSITKERGGICLSNAYYGNKVKLEFECKNGHKWQAVPSSIKNGTWCPVCSRNSATIEEVRELAKNNKGLCQSETFENQKSKLAFRCKYGHEWSVQYRSIKNGSWCPECKKLENNKLELSKLNNIARINNGALLSTVYKGNLVRLEWQCMHGHKWFAMPKLIKRGVWCPHC